MQDCKGEVRELLSSVRETIGNCVERSSELGKLLIEEGFVIGEMSDFPDRGRAYNRGESTIYLSEARPIFIGESGIEFGDRFVVLTYRGRDYFAMLNLYDVSRYFQRS